MDLLKSLESRLDVIFNQKAPTLSRNAKKVIVQYLPWINLILGVFTLLAVRALWSWAHVANGLVNYVNNLNANYGLPAAPVHRMGFGIWLAVIVLAIEAILYIAAFPGTRAHKKSGWNLLFYALIINVVYGVIILFTSYGGISSLIETVIASAIGAYFLFQIRSTYTNATRRSVAKRS